MLSWSQSLTFAAAAVAIVLVPGPSVLFVVGRALTVGRRAALVTVVGNELGECVQVVAVAVGLGAVVAASATAYTVIKLVGGLYLIWLGVQAVRRRSTAAVGTGPGSVPRSLPRALADGFLVGLLNPKTIVFLIAVLPPFVVPGRAPVPVQVLLLGLLFVAIALVCDSVWALVAGTARDWLARSPRRLARLGGAGGVVMIGLGAGLLVSGRPD